MSLVEVKNEVAQWSAAERKQLASFLEELNQAQPDAYYADMDRRMKAMDQGDRVLQEDVEARHQALLRGGR